MKNLFTTKSSELSSDLTRGHASRPYNKLGMHLLNAYPQHIQALSFINVRMMTSQSKVHTANVEKFTYFVGTSDDSIHIITHKYLFCCYCTVKIESLHFCLCTQKSIKYIAYEEKIMSKVRQSLHFSISSTWMYLSMSTVNLLVTNMMVS